MSSTATPAMQRVLKMLGSSCKKHRPDAQRPITSKHFEVCMFLQNMFNNMIKEVLSNGIVPKKSEKNFVMSLRRFKHVVSSIRTIQEFMDRQEYAFVVLNIHTSRYIFSEELDRELRNYQRSETYLSVIRSLAIYEQV